MGRSDGLAKKLFQKLISLCSDFLVTFKAVCVCVYLMETDNIERYRLSLRKTTSEIHINLHQKII